MPRVSIETAKRLARDPQDVDRATQAARATETALAREKRRHDAEKWPNEFMAHWRCLPDAAELDEPVREHRFHATRKWRFDLAWTRLKVAVELHGGTWKRKSGHNGAGVAKDAAKINAAQELGWKVFVFAGDQLKNMAENVMQVADFIRGQTC